MPFNGSDLINQPWNTTWSPYTDFFQRIFGNGALFFLVPIMVLALSLYVKTRNITMVAMFMIGSGILMSSGSMFTNAPQVSLIFIIFTALGFVALILSLLFQQR